MSVDDLVTRILTQVEAAVDSDDPAWFLSPEATAVTEELEGRVLGSDEDVPLVAAYALGLAGWFRCFASGGAELRPLGSAVVFLAPVHAAERERVPEPLHPVYALLDGEPTGAGLDPYLAHDAAAGLMSLHQERHIPGWLPNAEKLMRHAVRGLTERSGLLGGVHSNLGLILLHRGTEADDVELLREAAACGRAAVDAPPGDRAEQARRHGNLGLTLKVLADATDDPAAARQGVTALRTAVELSEPGDLNHPLFLANLGAALREAALPPKDVRGLREAVTTLRLALAAMGPADPRQAEPLSELGVALLALAPEDRRHELFDEGVAALQQALAATRNADARLRYRSNLAYSLLGWAQQAEDPAPLALAEAAARQAVRDAPPGHRLRARVLFVLSEVGRRRFTVSGGLDDLAAAISAAEESLELTPPGHRMRYARLTDLGDLLRVRAESTRSPEPLARALGLLRQGVRESAAGSARRAKALFTLGLALELAHQLDRAGQDAQASFEESVRCLRECLSLPSPDADFCAQPRAALGRLLARHGGPDGWAEGVELVRQAVELSRAGGRSRAKYLDDLGAMYARRAGATSDPLLSEEAVRLMREAAPEGSSGADGARLRSNLAVVVNHHGWLTGDVELLDESVRIHRSAVAASPAGDHKRPLRLGNLGEALQTVAELTSDIGLLQESILILREAAGNEDHPDVPDVLSRLGASLLSLTRFTGEPAHLEEAVRCHRRALALSTGTATTQLALLANALEDLAQYSQDERLRDEAMQLFRTALDSDCSPEQRAVLLNNLGRSQWRRAASTGDDALLGTAVATLRRAVATLPGRHVRRAAMLNLLGVALMERSSLTGDTTWLAEAIDALRQGHELCPPSDFSRAALLSNLSSALRVRFEAGHDHADAEEAIALLREAVAFEGGERMGTELARINLGIVLHTLATVDGDATRADEAIAVLEECLTGLGPDHARRGFVLTNLAGVCWTRAELHADTRSPAYAAALRRAVAAGREALTRLPDGQPDQARAQWILARALLRGAAVGQRVDLAEAARLARQAARSRTLSIQKRLQAARAWGDTAAAAGQDTAALAGYAYAVELLARAAPRSLNRADQEEQLGLALGLASDAAAMALKAGDPTRALTLLEQGRGVLLGQELDARGDLSRLRALDPALAREFEQVRDALGIEAAAAPAVGTVAGAVDMVLAHADAARRAEERHARARDWDGIVGRIRELPSMERFLAPPLPEELLAAAAGGPVAVVNVSRHRSDALLITAERIDVVEMRGLSDSTALNRALAFITAVNQAYGESGTQRAPAAMRLMTETLEWLWDVIAKPVLDRLGLRCTPADDEPWPRLWWCPTGWLSLLPLHAAGRHLARSGESVLDRVVSSSTPTVRALALARTQVVGQPAAPPNPLVVTLPQTPGAKDLPGAEAEAALLARLFPGLHQLVGPQATVEAVRRALPGHSWVHFSCHGLSDLEHPSNSGLQLYDGRLTVVDAAARQLSHPALAVLSSCSSSQGGLTVPDEAIHVASSFQLAGYPHVIGTLWPVSDRLSTRIAEELYDSLAREVAQRWPIDPAAALHHPVRALRDDLAAAPHLWAAHIHIGP